MTGVSIAAQRGEANTMNVLMTGLPFGRERSVLAGYESERGHAFRMLGCGDDADYTFDASETALDVVDRVSRDWRPDALFCWFPELYPPPLEVENAPIKTVAAVSDWHVYAAQLRHNLSRYDLVLTDKLGSQSLRFENVDPNYFMPLYAQDPDLHRPMGLERDIDVLFLGSRSEAVNPRRARLLERLATIADRRRIVIDTGYGDEEYASMLNRARIVFNHSVRNEMNLRCFEAPACGALLFVEEDNIEVNEYLEDRRDVVLYRPNNLLELIEYYLDHDDEERTIAKNGQEMVERLAPLNRLDRLFDLIDQAPSGRRFFRELSEPDRIFATAIGLASSLVPAQRTVAHDLLKEALSRYPDEPQFLVASACLALENAQTDPENRPRLSGEAVNALRQACQHGPDAIPSWLNLAFVCRHGGAGLEAEAACLEHALHAKSCDLADMLLDMTDDPYYHNWRRAAATAETQPELLWAKAAIRLADVRIEQGRFAEGLEMATLVLNWDSESAHPYRTAARAAEAMGDSKSAVSYLERGLEFTAFDAPYRLDLVRLLHAIGREHEACTVAADSARIFNACPREAQIVKEFRGFYASR
jgi:hypothetical protein